MRHDPVHGVRYGRQRKQGVLRSCLSGRMCCIYLKSHFVTGGYCRAGTMHACTGFRAIYCVPCRRAATACPQQCAAKGKPLTTNGSAKRHLAELDLDRFTMVVDDLIGQTTWISCDCYALPAPTRIRTKLTLQTMACYIITHVRSMEESVSSRYTRNEVRMSLAPKSLACACALDA
jgi:hypothetical protein